MQSEKPELLQSWARQLLREHNLFCRRYSLKLPRPIIEIVDVQSYWGKWSAANSTISLSLALLNNRPWETVLNVLKHEMAHQLLAEDLNSETGHGPEFKQACQRLGLPSSFCKSRCRITDGGPAATGRNSSEPDRILAKIRKLLSLADSNNEHESRLAIQKTRQLQAKYNLNPGFQGHDNSPLYTNLLINLKRKRIECYHRAICSLLLDYFQVEIVITPLYDARALTTYKHLDIMGTSTNVKIAGYLYHFLMNRLPLLWSAHQSENNGPIRGRNSYWLGVLNGFRAGLTDDRQVREKTPETAPAGKISSLVAINDPAIKVFVASRYPRLKNGRRRTNRIDPARFEAGRKDGLLLKFREGLNCEDGGQKLLE